MKHTETYIVDLNDFYEGQYLTISRRHTLEYGAGVLVNPLHDVGIQEGDHVTVYSDDEETAYEARVVKELRNDSYAVEVFWDSGVSVSASPLQGVSASAVINTGSQTVGPVVSR